MRGITHPEAMADFRANDEGESRRKVKTNRWTEVIHGKVTKVIRRPNSRNGNPKYRFTVEDGLGLVWIADSLPDVMWAYAKNWTDIEGANVTINITRSRYGWYLNSAPVIK